ncbi:hypothetical protein NL676_024668 [Syzygium grande]|nr:hypothetical protein NL676_024668 [Syzygium grande]
MLSSARVAARSSCASTSSGVAAPTSTAAPPRPLRLPRPHDPILFAASAVIGVLTGLDDYLYAYSVVRLPVSTSAVLIAAQLAFTAGFAFLLMRQRFTSYSINSIFLLTMGAGCWRCTRAATGRRGVGQDIIRRTLGAAVLYAFILPLVELTYEKAEQAVTYSLVLEIQLVMCFFAAAFCTVGMLVNKDFHLLTLSL